MPPVAALVSFRLGGPDGVSVQAATWGVALEQLGYRVHRVAGELPDGVGPDDVIVPGLAVAAEAPPGPDGQRPTTAPAPSEAELEAALAGADVVVVENMLALPLNLPAARVLTEVLTERLARAALDGTARPVLLHHHDLAWQRPETAHITELPPLLPGADHVAINDFSTRELNERGIPAVTIRNAFHLDEPLGDRDGTRSRLGVGPDAVLVLQPTRAIARKNIPAALALSEALADRLGRPVVYWLPGPAEDGYGATLAGLLATTAVPVRREGGIPMVDAYAACDLVVFPSTGEEGFGQPVIESVWARRPLAVLGYPALEEILGLGFSFLRADDPDAVAAALSVTARELDGRAEAEATAVFDRNLALAHAHFSMSALVNRLDALLTARRALGTARSET